MKPSFSNDHFSKQLLFLIFVFFIFSKFCSAVPSEEAIPFENLDYLKIEPPTYPELARRSGWEGTVVLKTLIERDGSCVSAMVEKSSGHLILDQAALQAVRKWEFSPARIGDFPYPSLTRIPIRFALADKK